MTTKRDSNKSEAGKKDERKPKLAKEKLKDLAPKGQGVRGGATWTYGLRCQHTR